MGDIGIGTEYKVPPLAIRVRPIKQKKNPWIEKNKMFSIRLTYEQ